METSPFTKEKRLQTYFANPYSSWERGINENSNRLIRRYFPKGTDFGSITQEMINLVVNKINYGKRYCLTNDSSIGEIKKLLMQYLTSSVYWTVVILSAKLKII